MINHETTSFEKFRGERSAEISLAVDITAQGITLCYYDLRLSRSFARAVFQGVQVSAENVADLLQKGIAAAGREFGVSAQAVKSVGFAAPVHISSLLEESISTQDLFLRPETQLFVLPYISAGISGRFTAALLTLPQGDCFAADVSDSLCLAKIDGGEIRCAGFALNGGFSAQALECGMLRANGAVDELSREGDGTLCYSVVGDADGEGIAASAAAMALDIMIGEGIVDENGIMTDRDMLYVGEDIFVSQKDIRALQSDRARLSAAIDAFAGEIPSKCFLSGEIFSQSGFKALLSVGALPQRLRGAGFSQQAVISGIIRCLENQHELDRAALIAANAKDITAEISEHADSLYIDRLPFVMP